MTLFSDTNVDSPEAGRGAFGPTVDRFDHNVDALLESCLLYTSDAADEHRDV